jgi:hypothetical protein
MQAFIHTGFTITNGRLRNFLGFSFEFSFVQGNNITGMVPVLGPQLGDNCVIESATFPGYVDVLFV